MFRSKKQSRAKLLNATVTTVQTDNTCVVLVDIHISVVYDIRSLKNNLPLMVIQALTTIPIYFTHFLTCIFTVE